MNFPDEWVGQRFKGSWKEGDPESGHGGCPNYATFPKNPQYGFELQEESELVCVRCSAAQPTLRSQLMWTCRPSPLQVVSQQDNRWEREGQPYQHAIGFVVMHVGGRPRCTRFSARHMVALSRTFSPLRSSACTLMQSITHAHIRTPVTALTCCSMHMCNNSRWRLYAAAWGLCHCALHLQAS